MQISVCQLFWPRAAGLNRIGFCGANDSRAFGSRGRRSHFAEKLEQLTKSCGWYGLARSTHRSLKTVLSGHKLAQHSVILLAQCLISLQAFIFRQKDLFACFRGPTPAWWFPAQIASLIKADSLDVGIFAQSVFTHCGPRTLARNGSLKPKYYPHVTVCGAAVLFAAPLCFVLSLPYLRATSEFDDAAFADAVIDATIADESAVFVAADETAAPVDLTAVPKLPPSDEPTRVAMRPSENTPTVAEYDHPDPVAPIDDAAAVRDMASIETSAPPAESSVPIPRMAKSQLLEPDVMGQAVIKPDMPEPEEVVSVDPAEARSRLSRVLADKAEAEAETRNSKNALDLAQDELAAAKGQVELRSAALTRQNDLRERGVGTDAAVENAALALSSAEASVLSRRQALANAQSRLDLSRTRLDRFGIEIEDAERALGDTEVYAEFDGTLSGTSVVRGGVVNVGERVATLIDANNLEVAFRVSSSQYSRLLNDAGFLINLPVTVSLDVLGFDLSSAGKITRESASVGEGQTGRLLFASVEGGKGLRTGDFVTVGVQEPEIRFVVRVPATAVSADGAVLVVGAEDRLEELNVEVMRRQGDDVLIRARELAGRDIVAERSPLIGTGIKVRPLRPGAADEAPGPPATVKLDDERRAKLIAFVEANKRMPDAVKERILGQLKQPEVPADMVERLEGRMGG